MGAGEHQPQALVGNIRLLHLRKFVGQQCQVVESRGPRPAAPAGIELPAAGDGQQPGFGIVRNARPRPIGKRRGEGFRQRVLRTRNIAGAGSEKGDEPAIGLAGDALGLAGNPVQGLAVADHGVTSPTSDAPRSPR